MARRCAGAREYPHLNDKAVSRWILLGAVLQILVLDREHGVRLDLDAADDALPLAGIAVTFGIVVAGLDIGDARSPLVVDRLSRP